MVGSLGARSDRVTRSRVSRPAGGAPSTASECQRSASWPYRKSSRRGRRLGIGMADHLQIGYDRVEVGITRLSHRPNKANPQGASAACAGRISMCRNAI